jgi:hypothetical protein
VWWQRCEDGCLVWLPESPASCSERDDSPDTETASFCRFMNVHSVLLHGAITAKADTISPIKVRTLSSFHQPDPLH